MKIIARVVTIAIPFGMSAFSLYTGLTRVSSDQLGWVMLIAGSFIATALSAINAHAVIDAWEK